MKSVVLEILNGSNARQRIWVRFGQVVYVGSTDRSDFIIESDAALAPQHLSIGHYSAGCFIECLDLDEGMTVNGINAQRRRLHDGDVVVVGNTRLKAHISDSRPPAPAKPAATSPPPSATEASAAIPAEHGEPTDEASAEAESPELPPASSEAAPAPAEPPAEHDHAPALAEPANLAGSSADLPPRVASTDCKYLANQVSSTVWLYNPSSDHSFPLADCLSQLAAKTPPRICVNTEHIVAEWELEEPDYRLQNGIHLSSVSDPKQLLELLQANRDHDAVMVIFSELTTQQLQHNLVGHAFSFGRPSIFATQVSVATPGLAEKLLHQISAILIVDAEEDWNLFSALDVASAWVQFGFASPPENIDEIQRASE